MPQEDIHTVCRIRPLNAVPVSKKEERNQKLRSKVPVQGRCVAVDPMSNKNRVVYTHQPGTVKNKRSTASGTRGNAQEDVTLSFDYVADEEVTQEELYIKVGAPAVMSCLQGYNGSILCYGQTASGKTHTCFGRSNTADAGLVPRALRHLFLGSSTGNPVSDPHSPGKGQTKAGSHMSSYDKENSHTLNIDYAFQVDSNPTGFRGITRYSPLKQSRHSFGAPGQRSGTSGQGTFVCKCSFYEIYQERVYDLLLYSEGPSSSTECIVREDTALGVFVDNCTEVVLDDLAAAEEVLSIGLKNRSMAETAMNHLSSRSHAIFQLNIEYTETTSGAGNEVLIKRTSKFRLIDLAGSERQKDTYTTSIRLKEAALINKSLSTLGRVINALVEAGNSGLNSGAFIPYRDSKLTFLLRDALGGNSKTTLLATVSPSLSCAFDTLSTLRFVNRAKCIRNAVIMNEQCFESVNELKEEILNLKSDLEFERSTNQRLSATVAALTAQLEFMHEKNIRVEMCSTSMNTSVIEERNIRCDTADTVTRLSEAEKNTSPYHDRVFMSDEKGAAEICTICMNTSEIKVENPMCEENTTIARLSEIGTNTSPYRSMNSTEYNFPATEMCSTSMNTSELEVDCNHQEYEATTSRVRLSEAGTNTSPFHSKSEICEENVAIEMCNTSMNTSEVMGGNIYCCAICQANNTIARLSEAGANTSAYHNSLDSQCATPYSVGSVLSNTIGCMVSGGAETHSPNVYSSPSNTKRSARSSVLVSGGGKNNCMFSPSNSVGGSNDGVISPIPSFPLSRSQECACTMNSPLGVVVVASTPRGSSRGNDSSNQIDMLCDANAEASPTLMPVWDEVRDTGDLLVEEEEAYTNETKNEFTPPPVVKHGCFGFLFMKKRGKRGKKQ